MCDAGVMTSVAAAWAEEAEASHRDSAEDTGQGPDLATPGLAALASQPLTAHGAHGGHANILEAGAGPVLGDDVRDRVRVLEAQAPAGVAHLEVDELGRVEAGERLALDAVQQQVDVGDDREAAHRAVPPQGSVPHGQRAPARSIPLDPIRPL